MKRLFIVVAAGLAVSACGDEGVSGTYKAKGTGILEKLEFTSDKVDVTGLGETKQGTYMVDGDKVTVTIDGEGQIFTRDKEGCLDGGMLLGKYCKE